MVAATSSFDGVVHIRFVWPKEPPWYAVIRSVFRIPGPVQLLYEVAKGKKHRERGAAQLLDVWAIKT